MLSALASTLSLNEEMVTKMTTTTTTMMRDALLLAPTLRRD
jgi:hypothetical protein